VIIQYYSLRLLHVLKGTLVIVVLTILHVLEVLVVASFYWCALYRLW